VQANILFTKTLNRSRTGHNWYLPKPKWWRAKLALPRLKNEWRLSFSI